MSMNKNTDATKKKGMELTDKTMEQVAGGKIVKRTEVKEVTRGLFRRKKEKYEVDFYDIVSEWPDNYGQVVQTIRDQDYAGWYDQGYHERLRNS